MNVSAPQSSIAGARFAATFVATAVVTIAALAALVFWRDPFWVLRDAPPWTRDGFGVSRLLDVEMRRVKPLQIARLRPATVLVGSSVTYRGLDPHEVSGALPRPVYNAGLSSLMAAELPVMAGLLRDIGSVRHVVLGLDYFMFTALPPPPPLRAEFETQGGRERMLLGTFLNSDVLLSLLARRVRTEPGAWRGDGFKTTPDFDAALTIRVSEAQNIAAMVYRPGHLRDLERALETLKPVRVTLYLSPVSDAQLGLLHRGGRDAELARWRADIAAIAARQGLAFHDLVDSHPFHDFDPARGSSRFWIDTMHFKPEVGRWVLSELGLG